MPWCSYFMSWALRFFANVWFPILVRVYWCVSLLPVELLAWNPACHQLWALSIQRLLRVFRYAVLSVFFYSHCLGRKHFLTRYPIRPMDEWIEIKYVLFGRSLLFYTAGVRPRALPCNCTCYCARHQTRPCPFSTVWMCWRSRNSRLWTWSAKVCFILLLSFSWLMFRMARLYLFNAWWRRDIDQKEQRNLRSCMNLITFSWLMNYSFYYLLLWLFF
jgi:hypothetical protein